MPTPPRCPKDLIAQYACVTEKCIASPFMCEDRDYCDCGNAHRCCKVMRWGSVVEMLGGYRDHLPDLMKVYISRVEKIYNNIITKLQSQLQTFHQYIQHQLYGPTYQTLLHHISKQTYTKITNPMLAQLITKMTQKPVTKKASQEGVTSLERFSVGDMRKLEGVVDGLVGVVEELWRGKFGVVDRELRELREGGNGWRRENGVGDCRAESRRENYSYGHRSTQSFDRFENVALAQSLVFQQSDHKFSNMGTTSSNFFNKTQPQKSTSLLKQTKTTHLSNLNPNPNPQSLFHTSILNPSSLSLSKPIYPKSIPSKIIPNAFMLNHFLQCKVKQYKLIYRASDHGYQIGEFYQTIRKYSFCDQTPGKGKGNGSGSGSQITLLLARTQFGRVVGGWTGLRWERGEKRGKVEEEDEDNWNESDRKIENFKQDIRGTSTMFSIDLNQKYQLLDPKYAIYCGSKSIGFGKNDFRIVNHCSKHSKNFLGFPNSYNNGNYLPTKKSSLTLSGSHDSSHFKITQWQMFQVVFHIHKSNSSTRK